MSSATGRSWPADPGRGRIGREHLSSSSGDGIVDVLDAIPLGGEHEQGPPIGAAQCTDEAGPVELDALQDLAAFPDSDAFAIGTVVATRVGASVG
jgi:hypothetical protein